MSHRLTVWFALALARITGRRRPVGEAPATGGPVPLCTRPVAGAPPTPDATSPGPAYTVSGPLWRGMHKWSVHNRALSRPVATGLSRRQAETLRQLLSFADSRPPAARSQANDSLDHRTGF